MHLCANLSVVFCHHFFTEVLATLPSYLENKVALCVCSVVRPVYVISMWLKRHTLQHIIDNCHYTTLLKAGQVCRARLVFNSLLFTHTCRSLINRSLITHQWSVPWICSYKKIYAACVSVYCSSNTASWRLVKYIASPSSSRYWLWHYGWCRRQKKRPRSSVRFVSILVFSHRCSRWVCLWVFRWIMPFIRSSKQKSV